MSYTQRRRQTKLPGSIVVRRGVDYDRVIVDGHTAASRNNKTGRMSGVTVYFKFLPRR
jgi:hypothetical protein